MADFAGIRPIPPSYPVRPTQPVNRDEDKDKERRDKRRDPDEKEPASPEPPTNVDRGDDDRPTIDEHV